MVYRQSFNDRLQFFQRLFRVGQKSLEPCDTIFALLFYQRRRERTQMLRPLPVHGTVDIVVYQGPGFS